jgi:hypothetical protein
MQIAAEIAAFPALAITDFKSLKDVGGVFNHVG